MTHFTIRHAAQPDMTYIIDQCRREGWNPGLADEACFFAADPAGFLIAELDGRPIGCVSAVRYPGDTPDGDFGFIGCYIVEPAYRGSIYGPNLARQAIARLDGCNIGLDGVVAQQDHYRHAGFKLAHRNLRYAGQTADWSGPPAGSPLIDAASLPFAQLEAYDRLHFPTPRHAFLQAWLTAASHRSLAYVEAGQILGFGTVRACASGYKVGPLFANNAGIAEALLLGLVERIRQELVPLAPGDPDTTIYLDISEENQAAMALVRQLNMTFVFETARMYSGSRPDLNWDQVYGITTFELG